MINARDKQKNNNVEQNKENKNATHKKRVVDTNVRSS